MVFRVSVNASFSEGFLEKCWRFHSNGGHFKEEFILGNAGYKYVTWIDCKSKFDFWFFWGRHYMQLVKTPQSLWPIPANIPKTVSPHNAKWLVSQSRLEKIHKRFTGTAAVLDPQVGLTHSTDVVCTILFLWATSFNSFHFLSIGNTFACALGLDKFCRQNFEQNKRFWGRAFCRQNKAFSSKIWAE